MDLPKTVRFVTLAIFVPALTRLVKD